MLKGGKVGPGCWTRRRETEGGETKKNGNTLSPSRRCNTDADRLEKKSYKNEGAPGREKGGIDAIAQLDRRWIEQCWEFVNRPVEGKRPSVRGPGLERGGRKDGRVNLHICSTVVGKPTGGVSARKKGGGTKRAGTQVIGARVPRG